MNKENLVHLAGCIVTDKESRILLMHRPGRDEWELPGGRIDDPEEPYEIAAARQMFEELGLDVEINESIGETELERDGNNYLFHWYMAKIVSGNPQCKEPAECNDVKYFSHQDLTNLKVSPVLRDLLKKIKSY